jgi:VWFA-related protein
MKKETFFRLLILVGILLGASFGFAQGVQDSVWVHIEEISIRGNEPFRGFAPAFPYPVMTTLTVVNREGNFIIGLADTAKWLGPMDVAEIGVPVASLWKPILEYHRDDPDFPDDPDLTRQPFEPRITEVREDRNTPATTMLVMDMSSSMDELVEEVKVGARQYVESLRDVDRTGVILFNRAVTGILPITSNKDSLYEFINNAQLGNGTAIYDGLIAAIDVIKHENARPRIVVYTDGADHNSQNTPEVVIDSALVHRIPIFTIALGNGSYATDLQRIANGTGGLFFQADNTTQMQDVYTKLAALIRNFYMMIHFSPDPTWNNTWRTVDVTLDGSSYLGHGTGDYFVAGLTDENRTDVALDLTAVTERVTFENGDSLHWVSAGEQFHYTIRLTNTGPHRANYVKVVQTIPDSINILNISVEPRNSNSKTLVWHFLNLESGDEEAIHLTAELAGNVPRDVRRLESQILLTADTDDHPANNSDSATVFVFRPAPPKNFELALSQTVATDTTVILNGVPQPAVWSNAVFAQSLWLKNTGPATAYNISLSGALAPELTPRNLEASGGVVRNDSLFWEIDSLAAHDSLEIKFNPQVAEFIPFHFYPLVSRFQVAAENDDSSANNFAQSRVLGLKHKLHDVAVQQFVSADSFAIVNGDTLLFVRPGEKYYYAILVSNASPDTALNVVLQDAFPDSVTISDIQPGADLISEKFLQWSLGTLLPNSQRSYRFAATVSANLPVGTTPLVNRAVVSADDEAAAKTGNNSSVTTIYSTVAAPQIFELSLLQHVVTDTTVGLDGLFEPAVWSGSQFEQILVLKNAGPEMASNILLWGLLARELSPLNLAESGGFIRADTIFWEIAALAAGDSLEISFRAKVSASIPFNYFPLISSFQAAARNDISPENNAVQSRVIVLKRQAPLVADVAVASFVATDSLIVVAGDSIWLVAPGEKYDYTLVVSNVSPDTALNVVLRDFLPDWVTVSEIQPETGVVTSDSLRWTIGDLLPFSRQVVRFAATLAPKMPVGYNFLIHQAVVSAENEAPDKLTNNAITDTTYNVVLPVDAFLPQIEAQPPTVAVGDPVSVRVQVEVPIRVWDIWVYFENGVIDSTYANEYIQATRLPVGEWVPIPLPYENTRLVTELEQEHLIFEIRVLDCCGLVNTARTSVTIGSGNDFNLDRNIFAAATEADLGINFKLSSNRIASLELFDIAGTRITRIAEQPFTAGWNTYTWNGMTEYGQKVGSGLYIIILRSGGYNSWKKLIVVQ